MVCGRFIEVAGFHKVSVPNQGRNGFRIIEPVAIFLWLNCANSVRSLLP